MRSKGLAPFPPRSSVLSRTRVVLQFLASGLEGAVVKHVLDHVVNSTTVSRVQSAGCLAGLFTFCSGINCIQAKELTDTGRDRFRLAHPGLDVVGGAHRGARPQERREARKAEPGFVPQEKPGPAQSQGIPPSPGGYCVALQLMDWRGLRSAQYGQRYRLVRVTAQHFTSRWR